MELPHISVSTVESFATCPRRGYLRKHHEAVKNPALESSATAFGSLVHEVLEHYHGAILGDETLKDYDSLVDYYDHLCKQWDVFELSRYQDFREAVAMHEANNPPNPNTVAIEKKFDIQVGEFSVKGIIDRIDYLGDGVYRICDYKSSFIQKTLWEVEDDLQLQSYDVALRRMLEAGEITLEGVPLPEATRVMCGIHYIRTDTVVEAEYTDEQRESVQKYMCIMGYKIENMVEEPPPSVNIFCFYCERKESCVLYEGDFAALENLPEGLDTETLVANFISVDSAQKALKKKHEKLQSILLARMDEEGVKNLPGGTHVVFPFHGSRSYYDTAGVMEELQDWSKFATLDPKAIESSDDARAKKVLQKYRRTKKNRPYLKYKTGR